MTMEAPVSGGDTVPRYFADFAAENARQHAELMKQHADSLAENARQHAELGAGIAELGGELRIIKGLVFGIGIMAFAALAKYLIGW